MYLKEEELSRILDGALEALGLTEANQTLAGQYLDLEETENPAILCRAEAQDFSRIAGLQREACLTWCKKLREWAGAEELLAGTYLYCVRPADGNAGQVVSDLEQRLLHRLPELFGGKVLSDPELLALCDFVRKAPVEEPIPAELLRILRGKQCSAYLFALLTGCAYLALDHSAFFQNFLRLAAAVDMETGMDRFLPVCRYMADRDWFFGHIDFLFHRLPIPPVVWTRWSFETREEGVWLRMVKEHPKAVKEVAEGLELWHYEQLLERVQRGNPALAKEIFCLESYRQKAAEELVTNFASGADTARRYFLEETYLEEMLPFVKEWKKSGSGYYGNKMTRLERLSKIPELQNMYRRAVVMEGLLSHGTYFTNYMFTPSGERDRTRKLTTQELDVLFDLLKEEQVPVFWQLNMLSCIHESLYYPEFQEAFLTECVKALDARIDRWGDDYQEAAEKASAFTRICCIRTMDLHSETYRDTLLICASDNSRQVRQVLLEIYRSHREWEEEIRALLGSKKQKARQMAVEVFKEWGVDSCRDEPERLLEKEKNGRRRQKVLWAFAEPFSPVHTTDGKEISEEYLQTLLACYASGTPEAAKKLAAPLDKAELEVCMVELFDRWLASGAGAKKKWVLYAASNHGGVQIVPLLYQQIKELPARSRGAMAVEAVHALAQNGSSDALLLVEQISRKFRYRQVKKGAAEALANAARALGISQEELEDRMVPDFGFDGQMKKQLKTVAASQKLRLSQALSVGRFWQPEGWMTLFVKNPVMHSFAAELIWGVYEDDILIQTFRYMEDGSFDTAAEEPGTLPEKYLIGLVHPVELPWAEREAWKEQLTDYEITQPFEQIFRPFYECTDEEAAQTELLRFQGIKVNALSLAGKLTACGWNKGPVGDGGTYDTFYREDQRVVTELSFSGCGIACENMEVELYGVVFRKSEDRTEKLYLGELTPRYFSEIVLQLTKAAGFPLPTQTPFLPRARRSSH